MESKLNMQQNMDSSKKSLPTGVNEELSESPGDLKKPIDRIQRQCTRNRRPDMQLYVPKAKRISEIRTKSPIKSNQEVEIMSTPRKATENANEIKIQLTPKPKERRTISKRAPVPNNDKIIDQIFIPNVLDVNETLSNFHLSNDSNHSRCVESQTCAENVNSEKLYESHDTTDRTMELLPEVKNSIDNDSNSSIFLECREESDRNVVQQLDDINSPIGLQSSSLVTKENISFPDANCVTANIFDDGKERFRPDSSISATVSNSNQVIDDQQVSSSHSGVAHTTEMITHSTTEEQKSSQKIITKEDIVTAKNDATVSNCPSSSSEIVKTTITDEDSWEVLYSDTGECLDPSLLNELVSVVGNVHIETPEIDYLSFQANGPQLSDEDFGHVLELYDFPPEMKTEDLISSLTAFKGQGFSIKWVDDTHALAVFSSSKVAQDVLLDHSPIVKARPLSQGIRESKLKACKCAEFLKPYKPRPQTTAFLANRLVAGALGLQLPISKNHEAERKKLREAKERKMLAIKQKEEAWEGIFEGDS